MTTPAGTIKASDVNTELGKSTTALMSLNASDVRALAGVSSGQISYNNLRGKSSFTLAFSSGNGFDQRQSTTSSTGGYAWAQFTLNTNGTISSAGESFNSGGGGGVNSVLDTDIKPTAWGSPTTAGIGSNYEALLNVTALSRGNGGEVGTWGGTSITTTGNTAYVTLSSATSLFAGAGTGYGGADIYIQGTLYIRHKTTLVTISRAFNIVANAAL
jgi:hypothetical protein